MAVSTNAASAGCVYRSRCHKTTRTRGGTGSASCARCTFLSVSSTASSGDKATPTPAATMAWTGDHHFDVRPALPDAPQHLGQHLVGDALVDPDSQAARPPSHVSAKVGLRRPQPRFDRVGVAQEQPPRLGQLVRAPASRPLDQALPHQRLQGSDVIADSRERAVQLLGRRPEGPGFRDRAEGPQMFELDALPIIRHGDILSGKSMLLRRFKVGTLKPWESCWRPSSRVGSPWCLACWRRSAELTPARSTPTGRPAGGLRLRATDPITVTIW